MDKADEIFVRSICVISGRWPVAPFNGQFPDPHDSSIIVTYFVRFDHREYLIEANSNFTVITLVHRLDQEYTISKLNNGVIWNPEDIITHGEVARYVAELVNYLIDMVQATFRETDTNPFPHIRRVGIGDFFSMDNFQIDIQGNRLGQGFSFANLAVDSKMVKRSVGIVSQVNFSIDHDIPIEKIKILRAIELLNNGYHSEALLISFALLDSFVQRALERILTEKGVENPLKEIQKIRTQRMTTFLDSVLRTYTCHSLKADAPKIWANLIETNGKRNNAIHSSADISYRDAKLAIETTRDVLIYLSVISPTIPRLEIDRLPFLFEIND